MDKIDLPFFYRFANGLNSLVGLHVDQSNRMEFIPNALQVFGPLKTLLDNYPLTVCKQPGNELYEAINQCFVWLGSNSNEWEKEDSSADFTFRKVTDLARKFETILLAEIQTLAAYYVQQTGAYDTDALVERAENVFPNATKQKLNEEIIEEIRQSGKCLAFENATASGFHVMRATESMIHEYYLEVCEPNPKPKGRLANWGAYIKVLKDVKDPDVQEVVAILQQIKDRHRNLIMHPEIVLTSDEAHSLFEIAKGAIITTAERLPTQTEKPPAITELAGL